MKITTIVALLATLLLSAFAGAEDVPMLSREDRATLLTLPRDYRAARTNPLEQRAVVGRAIEVGEMGVARLLPLVQAEAESALKSYVALFSAQARKTQAKDTPSVLASHVQLPAMRERLLHLGTMWSQLEAAAGEEAFNAEERLSQQEEQVLRVLRLGPVLAKLDDQEIAAIELTNQQRAANSLPPLEVDLALCLTARDHSKDMVNLGFFSHQSPVTGKTTFSDRGKRFGTLAHGENIFAGDTQAATALGFWMNSDGHRANILNADYKRIGIGRVDKHWTQVFGK